MELWRSNWLARGLFRKRWRHLHENCVMNRQQECDERLRNVTWTWAYHAPTHTGQQNRDNERGGVWSATVSNGHRTTTVEQTDRAKPTVSLDFCFDFIGFFGFLLFFFFCYLCFYIFFFVFFLFFYTLFFHCKYNSYNK